MGGEAARYGKGRVAKLVLTGAVTPIMLQTPSNPGGLPIETFDGIRAGVLADRSQFYKDLTTPFHGANRPESKVSRGLRDSFWMQGMMGRLKGEYDCIKAVTAPTLVLHGDDDQIVPTGDSARLAVKLLRNGTLKVIAGAPHGMCSTNKDEVNAALLAFAKG